MKKIFEFYSSYGKNYFRYYYKKRKFQIIIN